MKQAPSHRYAPSHSSFLSQKPGKLVFVSLEICYKSGNHMLGHIQLSCLSTWSFSLVFMKESASPHMCISLVSYSFVFEVNPCFVWLLTVLHLARPSAVWVNVLGDYGSKGLGWACRDDSSLHIHLFLLQVVNNWEMYLQIGSILLFPGSDINLMLTFTWITSCFEEHRKQIQCSHFMRHAVKGR